ncbi:MAG TPA: hypothetical protein PLL20_20130 [Phycisphaerae bacterium]|nr:hypothetical protein [Phycisphaerae bacterium]HRR87420.1 hypothetical protein [Phycisphaerae bacterium]
MKLHRIYRFVLLAATGGVVFQATSSCSTEFSSTLSTALQQVIISAFEAVVRAYLNQLLYGTI